MKFFTKILFIYSAFFCVLANGQTAPSGFQTIFYEGFDYPAGQDLYYQSGGTGFTSNWGGYYQSKYLSVQSAGLTYPNLLTTGLRAGYDGTCYGSCNDISSSGREIPSQSSGVLYVQFLANFGTQAGGGTPHFRLYNGSNLKVALGSMTTSSWQMLDVDSNTTVSTSSSLSGLKLVVIRFDYDNNNMKLWINPNLATFDYSNAPTPSTEINNITVSSFNRLELYFRSNGTPGIDEIHAFRSLTPTTFGTFAAITKQYFAGPHTIVPPTTNNSNPIVYTSDNTAVATLSGSVITFTGIGTATITATQAADANYGGNSISTLLTVLGKDLVSKYGGISSTDVNFVNANGSIGGNLGLNKNGAVQDPYENLVTSGLIMHLDAGDPTSYLGTGTTWTDISGNGNHGVLRNGVGFSGINNGTMVFDGINDYVATPIDADLQVMPSTTWSGWIKSTGASNWQVIFGMEDGGWDRFLIVESGGLGLSMGHTSNRWLTGAFVNPSVWQHVVAIYDNGSMKFYLNGIEYNTSTSEGNHASNGTFTIGSNQNGGGNFYSGNIAQVSVYNRVLTAAEIQQNYNAVKVRYGL